VSSLNALFSQVRGATAWASATAPLEAAPAALAAAAAPLRAAGEDNATGGGAASISENATVRVKMGEAGRAAIAGDAREQAESAAAAETADADAMAPMASAADAGAWDSGAPGGAVQPWREQMAAARARRREEHRWASAGIARAGLLAAWALVAAMLLAYCARRRPRARAAAPAA
jgi:hypothetical protein